MKHMKKLFIAIHLFSINTAYSTEVNMFKINVGLGKIIVETARNSGVPKFASSNFDGFIEYSLLQVPPDALIAFNKPGYELSINPVFSLVMNADRHRTPDDRVYSITLAIPRRLLQSHEAGQAFIESLIAQFQTGRWKRHIGDECPAVTGRSSMLDENGEPALRYCGLDPSYKISSSEWKIVFEKQQKYEWIGDGVLATLTASHDNESDGVIYEINLKLEDYQTALAINNENEKRNEQEGDANGWKTSEKNRKAQQDATQRVKILEANAIKRGDTVIPR